VAVSFGSSPCAVTRATFNTITCVTSAAPAGGFGAQPLALVPAAGAPEQSLPAATFTYDASLTPTVTAVSPRRGSTAGGTNLTIVGSDFGADVSLLTVLLGNGTTGGGAACGNLILLNSSALQCTTSAAGNGALPPQGELAVRVRRAARSSCTSCAQQQCCLVPEQPDSLQEVEPALTRCLAGLVVLPCLLLPWKELTLPVPPWGTLIRTFELEYPLVPPSRARPAACSRAGSAGARCAGGA
jgi:hypothetical protein